MSIAKETTVRFRIDGKKVFGVVKTDAALTASGPVVSVQLLPDFGHLTPTGWLDMSTAELTPVRVCACATLGYRPIWGDHKGELYTTGCDFSRQPSRGGKFLPGHDAKAKGFLIRAYSENSTLESGKGALETARELSDKIAAHVAAGVQKAREKRQREAVRPKRRGASVSTMDADRPATREDQLTEAQRLQRELGVTDAMLTALANAIARHEGQFVPAPTGTKLALTRRELTSGGALTDLGYRVMDHPTFAETSPDKVVCTTGKGSYSWHLLSGGPARLTEDGQLACRRCGKAA